jgi:hypothetical protein
MNSFNTLQGNGSLTLSVTENNGTINTTISHDGPGMTDEEQKKTLRDRLQRRTW